MKTALKITPGRKYWSPKKITLKRPSIFGYNKNCMNNLEQAEQEQEQEITFFVNLNVKLCKPPRCSCSVKLIQLYK